MSKFLFFTKLRNDVDIGNLKSTTKSKELSLQLRRNEDRKEKDFLEKIVNG